MLFLTLALQINRAYVAKFSSFYAISLYPTFLILPLDLTSTLAAATFQTKIKLKKKKYNVQQVVIAILTAITSPGEGQLCTEEDETMTMCGAKHPHVWHLSSMLHSELKSEKSEI